MTDELIKEMVAPLLFRWKLLADFAPDAGISFRPNSMEHTQRTPCGTSLLAQTTFQRCLQAGSDDPTYAGE